MYDTVDDDIWYEDDTAAELFDPDDWEGQEEPGGWGGEGAPGWDSDGEEEDEE